MGEKRAKNVSAIIQARMGSTRLPGKALKQVLGEPLLFYVISRLKQANCLSNIIVATTNHPKDKEITDYCDEIAIPYYRGSEENVLERYLNTARFIGSDVIVRITADCPLIDPDIVDLAVDLFLNNDRRLEFVSNTLFRSFPRGLDVEVFSFEALEKAESIATTADDREHVTLAMTRNPNQFKIKNFIHPVDLSSYRLTVDTHEDFRLVSKIIETLYPLNLKFRMNDIIQLLSLHPDWLLINQHISQKKIGE